MVELAYTGGLGPPASWLVGSSPTSRTSSKFFYFFAGVAQLVEHHVANVDVVGPNPIARSRYFEL